MTDTKFEITCPCCEATIVVDRATGVVVSHAERKDPNKAGSIAEIMQGLAARKESSEKLFEREMSSMKDRERLLDEKMQEALKRAKESKDEKPLRPIDLE